jgi:hypothetical protein
MSALAFLGGTAFRLMFGEVTSYLNKRHDHKLELERLKIQAQHDRENHERLLEMTRLQSELGAQNIRVQRDADLELVEANAWRGAVDSVGRQTGNKFVDVWNGSIRPMLATLSIFAVIAEIAAAGFVLSGWHQELISAILGIYVASRDLSKRGK